MSSTDFDAEAAYPEKFNQRGKGHKGALKYKGTAKSYNRKIIHQSNASFVKREERRAEDAGHTKPSKAANLNRAQPGFAVGIEYSINKDKRWELIENLRRDEEVVVAEITTSPISKYNVQAEREFDAFINPNAVISDDEVDKKKKRGQKRKKKVSENGLQNTRPDYSEKTTFIELKTCDLESLPPAHRKNTPKFHCRCERCIPILNRHLKVAVDSDFSVNVRNSRKAEFDLE